MKNILVTIIIPTHERHLYLPRSLASLSETNFPIIIVDTSENKFLGDVGNAKYFHFPKMTVNEKRIFAYSQVNTAFALFWADDDFIVIESLLNALNFLSGNPDYSSAQGSLIGFEVCKNAPTIFYPVNTHGYELVLNQNNASERLAALFSNYMHMQYALCKTDLMRRVFNDAMEYRIENYNLVEILQVFYCLINGKHKVLPVFWSAREVISGTASEQDMRAGMEVIISSEKHKEEYERFIKATTLFYTEKEPISYEEAEQIIRKSVQLYVGTLNPWTIGRLDKDRLPFFARLKGDFFRKISNKLTRFHSNKLLQKYWYKKVYSKHYTILRHILFVQAKYFKGVPFFTRNGLKEIEKISKIIEKYPVQ